MTRFWIKIDDAAAFMLDHYLEASQDKAMIPPIKAANIIRVAQAVAKVLGVEDYRAQVTGLRSIEKIHEVLESSHAGCLRSDTCEQYSDDELIDLMRSALEAECSTF